MLKCWSVLPLAGSRGQRSNSIEMLGCGGCGGCCYYYNRQWLNIAATSTNAVRLRALHCQVGYSYSAPAPLSSEQRSYGIRHFE